jgi:CubicO group peptidase (beta-lactamase class C family)
VLVATIAARMADAGALDLDAPVSRWLPDIPPPTAPATLRQLLTHTAGIDDRMLGGLERPGPDPPGSLAGFFAAYPPRLARTPGATLSYSNLGAALAGLVLERATGVTFAALAEREVFEPLGMAHSTFRQPVPAAVGEYAPPFWMKPYPAGSLVTTADDMGRFLAAQLAGDVLLTSGARAEIQRTHWRAFPSMNGIALGWFEGRLRGHRALTHTGDAGHHSIAVLVPDAGVGFFFVASGLGDTDGALLRREVTDTIASVVLDERPGDPKGEPPRVEATLSDYVGAYRPNRIPRTSLERVAGLPDQLTVSLATNGGLQFQLGLFEEALPAVVVAPDLARTTDDTLVHFARASDGAVVRLEFAATGIGEPGSADRLAWWERSELHLGLIALGALLFLSRLLLALVGVPGAWGRAEASAPAEVPAAARVAWHGTALASLMVVTAPAVLIGGLIMSPKPIVGIPWFLTTSRGLLSAAGAAGVAMLPALAVLWHLSVWTRRRRVYVSLLIVASAALVPFLAYWRWLWLWS